MLFITVLKITFGLTFFVLHTYRTSYSNSKLAQIGPRNSKNIEVTPGENCTLFPYFK